MFSIVLPYDPTGEFSEAALQRLNAAGFDIFTPLLEKHDEFIKAIGISDMYLLDSLKYDFERGALDTFMSNAIHCWVSRRDEACRPPTWRSLLDLLKELGLGELSQQIGDYLSNNGMIKGYNCSALTVVT